MMPDEKIYGEAVGNPAPPSQSARVTETVKLCRRGAAARAESMPAMAVPASDPDGDNHRDQGSLSVELVLDRLGGRKGQPATRQC